jgi:sortase A
MKTRPGRLAILALLACSAVSAGSPPLAEGRIDIPRLGVAGRIREGADDDTLRVAVGHVPGTALPGPTGNVALAAHRYGYFRGLRGVRTGDEITVTMAGAVFHYSVDRIEVVEVTEVDVLDQTVDPTLTLITCYPFDYVGHAPRRLIVRAHRTDFQPAADAASESSKSRESAGAPTS